MLPLPVGREANPGVGASVYTRHRPERTLLYQLVQEYYPAFKAHLADQGSELPGYVEQEFEDYLKCGRLEHGFLRVRCAVTLIQRFGSALNLNVYFHMLFLDGVYVESPDGLLRFRWVKAPTSVELTRLAQAIALRIGRFLERQGWLTRDAENSYLVDDGLEVGPMDQLLGSSITYRIAVGPRQGRKVFTQQTLSACDEPFDDGVGKVAGFSLHAGVAARAHERKKLECLCCYISRPAVAEKRLSLAPNGNVRYQLKTPYCDGTTHVIFEPLDFMARLAALVSKLRANLTRFHGVFAPNSQHRAQVTPARRGKGNPGKVSDESQTPAERRASMTWASRLKLNRRWRFVGHHGIVTSRLLRGILGCVKPSRAILHLRQPLLRVFEQRHVDRHAIRPHVLG